MDALQENLIFRIKAGLKTRGIIPTFIESKKAYEEVFVKQDYSIGSMYRLINKKIVYGCDVPFDDENTRDSVYLSFLSNDIIGACSLAVHEVDEGKEMSGDMRVLISIRSIYIGNNPDKDNSTKGAVRFSVYAIQNLSVNDIYGEVDIGGEMQFYKLLILENET